MKNDFNVLVEIPAPDNKPEPNLLKLELAFQFMIATPAGFRTRSDDANKQIGDSARFHPATFRCGGTGGFHMTPEPVLSLGDGTRIHDANRKIGFAPCRHQTCGVIGNASGFLDMY